MRCCSHGGGHGSRRTHRISASGHMTLRANTQPPPTQKKTNKRNTTHLVLAMTFFFGTNVTNMLVFFLRQSVAQILTCCSPTCLRGKSLVTPPVDSHSSTTSITTPCLLPLRPFAGHHKYNILPLTLHRFFVFFSDSVVCSRWPR